MSGNPDIDQQHNELFSKLYKLRDAVKVGASREDIDRIIDDVISFTRFHLEYEEQVLDKYRFPNLDLHRNKHKELLNDVLQFKEKLRYVGESEFLEWFNHWPLKRFYAHIAYADKPAEDYINQIEASNNKG